MFSRRSVNRAVKVERKSTKGTPAALLTAAGAVAVIIGVRVLLAAGVALNVWLVLLLGVSLIVLLVVLVALVLTRDEDKSLIQFAAEFLAPPMAVVRQNLGPTEHLKYVAKPALAAFVIKNLSWIGISIGAGAVGVVLGTAVIGGVVGMSFAIFSVCAAAITLIARRFRDSYTLYVFTDDRVVRLSGVFTRQAAAIPWSRVVDFSWSQKFAGRVFSYATLRLDSASEKAALKELSDIPNRARIWLMLTR